MIRITPLFVLSVGCILYSLYLFAFRRHDEGGLMEAAALLLLYAGMVGMGVYAVLRAVFYKRLFIQIVIELAVGVVCLVVGG